MSYFKRLDFTIVIYAVIVVNFGVCEQLPSRLCQNKGIENCNDNVALALSDRCFADLNCDPSSMYYTFDGTCNNVVYSMWGQAGNGFIRRLKADYSDGLQSFRKAKDGSPLPNPRFVANTLFPIKSTLSDIYTVHFYGFGQWVTHDVAALEPVPVPASTPCCVNNTPAANMPEECMPVIIPKNDKFYSKFGVTCLQATRATSTRNVGCDITPPFKINTVTSYLDLSILYSVNRTVVDSLREFRGGRLRSITNTNRQEFPPTRNSCPRGGLEPVAGGSCMMTGDLRHNQNPELTVNELLFFRCHNYIADKIQKINPHFDDDLVFQETRRILIAFYQHVVFKEFLPIVIGPKFMENYKLNPREGGYATGYDNRINAGTDSHYDAGAARFPHTMILGKVGYKGDDGTTDTYLLRDKYFNQRFLSQGDTFKNIVIAYAELRCEKENDHHDEEIRNYLFKSLTPAQHFGTDLLSTDILRSRDFGLRSWNDVRKACSLPPAKSFDDLYRYLSNEKDVEKLKHLYKDVDDIDYYVAGLLEKQLSHSISGATAACISGDAFYTWKFGDRLYYEFESAKFTQSQLQFIRKTASFAWFICAANPEIKKIQKYPFKILSATYNVKFPSEEICEGKSAFPYFRLLLQNCFWDWRSMLETVAPILGKEIIEIWRTGIQEINPHINNPMVNCEDVLMQDFLSWRDRARY